MKYMLLQQESECHPWDMVPLRILVMVMLQVKQFSSAEGNGRSSHPKSATGSLNGDCPDHTQLLSLSISFPPVQNSNRVRRGFVR